MQILTPEAAQAEILNKDFTSSETVLPLPSFDQSLQHLLQQAFWWWTIQSLPWATQTKLALEHANQPAADNADSANFSSSAKRTAVRMHKHFSDDNRRLSGRKMGAQPILIWRKRAVDRFSESSPL